MRVKFMNYVTILAKNGERRSTHMGMDTLPLKHSICGIIYTPVNISGEFEECDKEFSFEDK